MRVKKVVIALSTVLLAAFVVNAAQAQATRPPAMPHTAEGRANCMMCHSGAMPNVAGVPADHEGRANTTCLWCHAPDAEMLTKDPTTIPHVLQGRANCLMCHSGSMPNVPAAPASHAGRTNEDCLMCHKTAG